MKGCPGTRMKRTLLRLQLCDYTLQLLRLAQIHIKITSIYFYHNALFCYCITMASGEVPKRRGFCRQLDEILTVRQLLCSGSQLLLWRNGRDEGVSGVRQ